MITPEIARLTGRTGPIELDFVERVHTPTEIMEYAVELHLNGLSLSNTVTALEGFGIERARSTIHNWVQKADLEPREGLILNKSHLMKRWLKSMANDSGSTGLLIQYQEESSTLASTHPEIRLLRECF